MKEIKRIGVLTSGGDAPGMNAAIRAVVRTGLYNGIAVSGVRKGFEGLITGDFEDEKIKSVSDIIDKGGTMLQTARSPEFKTEAGLKKAAKMCEVFGIDALVVLGGDGSFRGGVDLSNYGVPFIGVPCTIDNDISCTDYSIGYDTCVNTIRDAIDKIRDTSYSHQRCSVVEVMGRNAGYIALDVSIAGGAEAVILPEKPFDLDKDIIKPIIEGKNRGKKHYIVILAEGVGGAIEIAKKIEDVTGLTTRATILGYIQRGGSPTTRDRVFASLMGAKAINLLKENKFNRIVTYKNGVIGDVDANEALNMTKTIDDEKLEINRILSL